MTCRVKYIAILLLILLGVRLDVTAQKNNNPVIANEHLILLLDLHSTDSILDSILKNAGIYNADIRALKNGTYSFLQRLGWNVHLMPENMLRLDRSLATIAGKPFAITSKVMQVNDSPGYPADVLYGVNNFAHITVHELPNGLTRFYVPGRQSAKRVLLSGNFNRWSTLQGIMLKTDSGWIKDIRLEPGIYSYKYIINGNWQEDLNNNLKEDDGFGGSNSIYYRYNFSFKLRGYSNAHRVIVAGSFNHWNAGQLIMSQVSDGWELKLYLHEGIHQYHFFVDGRIITDPSNKIIGKDTSGKKISVLSLGKTINFKLGGYERAHKVYVAGNFNGWKPEDLQMQNINGVWTLPYILATGNYQYKFIVDGQWIIDPTNPHKAREGNEINSFIAVNSNYTFHLKGYRNAKSIKLSGTFNNWSEDGYTMEHTGDEWTISLRLKPGKYLYKFIVDGQWIIDPGNRLWEQNEHNTGNSVLWID